MKRILLLIIFLLFNFSVQSQHILSGNLVPNSGFEDFYYCPTDQGQINNAKYWFAEDSSGGSSDFIHNCSNSPFILSALNTKSPRTGFGMAGIRMLGNPNGNDYFEREYLQSFTKQYLLKNKKYCVNFYTLLVKYSIYAISNIGMSFRKNFYYSMVGNIISTNAQIKNNNSIVNDTIYWSKITGVLSPSDSLKYFLIGNFDSTINVNYQIININSPLNNYYFIDDVSVCECSFDINLGQDASLCEGESVILMPNLPNATYTWQDSSHAATYVVKQPGTYWVRAYVAEYDITSTDTIVISAGDNNICNPLLTIPNVITPNGDSQNDNFVIQNAETFEIALQIYNRWGNLIYETTSYQNDFSCTQYADGVYFYVLKAKSKRNGREKEYKGSLTVIKN
jgi:gliding motility-associated-like protein